MISAQLRQSDKRMSSITKCVARTVKQEAVMVAQVIKEDPKIEVISSSPPLSDRSDSYKKTRKLRGDHRARKNRIDKS